jgi:hypothetical protein
MRMARLGRHETSTGEVKGWNKTMALQTAVFSHSDDIDF